MTATAAVEFGSESVGRRAEDDGKDVAGACGGRESDSHDGRHDEGSATDDQRESEEEGTLHASRQRDEKRHDGDRNGTFDEELRRPEGAGREQLVNDQKSDA